MKREVRRARLCKNCPICPKMKKVFSNRAKVSQALPFPNIDSKSIKSTKLNVVAHGKLCPFKGCEETRKFKRLDKHLKKKHNLSVDSDIYQMLYSVREDGLQRNLKEVKKTSPSKNISLKKTQSISKSKILQINKENSFVGGEPSKAGSPFNYHSKIKGTSPASSEDISSKISQGISEDGLSKIFLVKMENSFGEAESNNASLPAISPAGSEPRAVDPRLLELLNIKSRRTFSLEERDLIVKAFQAYIDEDCLPSLPTIRQYMAKNSPLKAIVEEKNYQPSQIKGCLLNIINKRKKMNAIKSTLYNDNCHKEIKN